MERLKIRTYNLIVFILSFATSAVFLGWMIYSAIVGEHDITDIGYILFLIMCLIFFGPHIIIVISYLLLDISKKIDLDSDQNKLIIHHKNDSYEIERKDIIECYHVKMDGFKIFYHLYFWYEYIVLITNNNKRIIITNLLCDPKRIIKILKISTKTINPIIPMIDYKIGELTLSRSKYKDKNE